MSLSTSTLASTFIKFDDGIGYDLPTIDDNHLESNPMKNIISIYLISISILSFTACESSDSDENCLEFYDPYTGITEHQLFSDENCIFDEASHFLMNKMFF